MATTEFSKRPSVSDIAAEPKAGSKSAQKELIADDMDGLDSPVVVDPFAEDEDIDLVDVVAAKKGPLTTFDLIAYYDTSASLAAENFLPVASDKTAAPKLLRELALRNRDDVIEAITSPIRLDSNTGEYIVIERATALTRKGSTTKAAKLLEEFSRFRTKDYGFNYNAGKILHSAPAPHLAIRFLQAAIAIKPTPSAADRLFMCFILMGRYRDAVSALNLILQLGGYRESLRREFAALIKTIPIGEMDPADLETFATHFHDDAAVAGALIPHLIAADMPANVLNLADADLDAIDEETTLGLSTYLQQRGDVERALRLISRSRLQSQNIAEHLSEIIEELSRDQIENVALPCLNEAASGQESAATRVGYLAAAERLTLLGATDRALNVLATLYRTMGAETRVRFYPRYKARLALLIRAIGLQSDGDPATTRKLAQNITSWCDDWVKRFFAGRDFDDLIDDMTAAARFNGAPAGSRRAILREGYFQYHLERRVGVNVESLTSDVALCEAALKYFRTLSKWLPSDAVPVSSSLAGRLGTDSLSAFEKRIDRLTTFSIFRDRPQLNISSSDFYDELAWWYLTAFVPANNVPSAACAGAVEYFNEVLWTHDTPAINVTRFLHTTWRKSDTYRQKYDLENSIDCFMFAVDLAASLLSKLSQYRPLFRSIFALDANQGADGLSRQCLAILARDSNLDAPKHEGRGAQLLDAISDVRQPRKYVEVEGAPQDVLLIGHMGKGTGLARNFRMLSDALRTDSVALMPLDFDLDAEKMTEELVRWRERCQTRPVVVLAVNAQDVPEVFTKDRADALGDSYAAGFFLWETSKVPDIQRLGVRLVDEVWAPTRYVADIYGSMAQAHVVGKGLYNPQAVPPIAPPNEASEQACTFLTAFDFDSSIERKNPLAVVLAFQKAFRSGENVRLIVKTSNVNPQHWSNAFNHWERLRAACAPDPRIKLITSRFSDAQVTDLLRNASCFVSLHRSEGFGYMLADAMAFGTPVIATDYSGNCDFCKPDTFYPVSYQLVPVDSRAAYWKAEGAEWADADVDSAAQQMKRFYDSRGEAAEMARRARDTVLSLYSVERFRETLAGRLSTIRDQLRTS